MRRNKAIWIVVAVVYLLGIPSASSLDILSNQDHVWGIALMISGAFVAFSIIKSGATAVRKKELLSDPTDKYLGKWWEYIMKYFIPVAAFILLAWWLYLSATEYAGGQWYNPLNPFSIMTCLVQWFIMLAIFKGFNQKISKSMKD
jgi:NSS family neurotransmitter:Na+ symporter